MEFEFPNQVPVFGKEGSPERGLMDAWVALAAAIIADLHDHGDEKRLSEFQANLSHGVLHLVDNARLQDVLLTRLAAIFGKSPESKG